MQAVSPKSVSSIQRTYLQVGEPYLGHLYGSGSSQQVGSQYALPLELGYGFGEQGMSMHKITRIASLKQIRSRRPLLSETEEKIFGEVVGLLGEIEGLRGAVGGERETIRQLQVEHPDVEELVRYHGYSQPLTHRQCGDLQQQNAELFRKIQEFQSQQTPSLQATLAQQRGRYEQLKQELADSGSGAREEKVAELRNMVQQLERQRSSRIQVSYPGIERLRNENEELRQKTVALLKVEDLSRNEERELREYLQREEENREAFLQELKRFKGDFKRMKAENESLKERLGQGQGTRVRQSRAGEAKENGGAEMGESKHTNKSHKTIKTNKSSLQVESLLGKDRLSEYESFIRLMQQNVKS